METLKLIMIMAALGLPIHFAMAWQLDRLYDPRHVRRNGVTIERLEELEARDAVIGHYDGCEIYAWVQYLGMRYRFDRVERHTYRNWVGPRELFLEPGVVYVTD